MMLLLIWLLTAVMVLDCVALVLLVLIQLPKKEAGAGLAFGGAATDVLFGAGSGNVLTKITKWAAGTFFVLSVLLSIMESHYYHRSSSSFLNTLQAPAAATTSPASTTPAAPGVAPTPMSGTNSSLLTKPAVPAESTNQPAPASTNK